jgi:hypothetical protein
MCQQVSRRSKGGYKVGPLNFPLKGENEMIKPWARLQMHQLPSWWFLGVFVFIKYIFGHELTYTELFELVVVALLIGIHHTLSSTLPYIHNVLCTIEEKQSALTNVK